MRITRSSPKNVGILKPKRKLRIAVPTIAVVGSIALVGAFTLLFDLPSANAAAGECPSRALCVWEHDNFEGAILLPSFWGDGYSDFSRRYFEDTVSSARNNTDNPWCLFEHPNYEGRYIVIQPGEEVRSMGDFNDMASSARQCNENRIVFAPGGP